MEVFKRERLDGLEDKILSEVSIAYTTQLKAYDQNDFQKTFGSSNYGANPNQMDLYYLSSILASVGWNKNDDVFDKYEVWAARYSPVDKQFNFMHNEKDIIGHLTSSAAFDSEFNSIDLDTNPDKLPDIFDLVVGSVLYKRWGDSELQKRMDKIIAGIENKEWFVSMECLFPKFDYAVISPDGEQKVIARSEESSFLTKHLRAYGGSGEYEGFKIGRLLRNFVFSGKGLVDNPANTRSIILTSTANQSFHGQTTANFIKDNEEKIMADTISAEKHAELQKKFEDAMAQINVLTEKTNAKEVDSLKAQVKTLEDEKKALASELDGAKEVSTAKENKVKDLEKSLAEKDEEMKSVQQELHDMKTKARNAERMNKLSATNLDQEKAESLVAKFAEVSDEMFDELVASLPPKSNAEYMSDDEKKKEEEKKKKAKAEADAKAAEDAKNADLASAEINADESAQSLGNEDEGEALAKATASWLMNDVLKSTKSIKSQGE